MAKRNRLSAVRQGRHTNAESKKIVAMIRKLVEDGGSNMDLADAIYDEFLWDDTPQRDLSWSDLYDALRSTKDQHNFELRMKLVTMLEELDRWLDA
jgi:hypothetical protein